MTRYTRYRQFRIIGPNSNFYQYSITYCCLFYMTKASWAPAAWSWFSNVLLSLTYNIYANACYSSMSLLQANEV